MYCPACQAEYPPDWKACPKDAALLLRSPLIGKYRIEGMLGSGGMGAVYRAVNPDTKGRVAVKVMNPAVASAESARARFQREAAAVAALRTAHVVKVFDFGTAEDGTLYLVMELMDGHPLREEIRPAPEYMDLARVQMVMDGALKGLAAAHRAGIVHRDLKPENVYVADTDDGEVPKLLDFGIARVRTRDSDLTRTGSLMGTASYMASEQIAAGVGEIGPWSDVYAMGAILYEMLAGTPAFGGSTVTEVLQRVLKAESIPLHTVRPGLSAGAYQLVERCMSPQPTQRPQDAEAMRALLQNARLVPIGAPIPPAWKTRPDSPSASGVGLMMTAPTPQALTPHPQLTPPPLTPQPQLTPQPNVVRTPIPTGESPPDPIGPTVRSVGTGPSGGSMPPVATGTGDLAPPKKRALWPFALIGVLAIGGGTVAVVKGLGGGGGEDTPAVARDAHASVSADAASAIDAEQIASIDAGSTIDAGPEPTDGMVRIAGGDRVIGEGKPDNPDSLKATKVTIGEIWIDRDEVTLGKLREVLKDPKAGGMPGDTPDLPARRVTWEQARAACAAMGKRLPSEAEWEVAALTTPNDVGKAALMKPGRPVLAAPAKADCSDDGLCDMLGGVIEWTSDAGAGGTRIVRGASFKVGPTAGWQASIHARAMIPAKADEEVGFRCVYPPSTPGTNEPPKPTPADIKPTPPKPPVPEPPEPPKPLCDRASLDALRAQAREAFSAGQYARALSVAETALRCDIDGPAFHALACMAACNLGIAAKAKLHFAKLPPGRQAQARQVCTRNGIEP